MFKKVAFVGVGLVLLGTPLILSAQTVGASDTCSNNVTIACLENEVQQLLQVLNLLKQVSGGTTQPSATINQSSLTQSTATSFSITGELSGSASTDGVFALLVPSNYPFSTNYTTVLDYLGEPGFYRPTGAELTGRWNATFQNVAPGSYLVLVYDSANARAPLTQSVLTVTNGSNSNAPQAAITSSTTQNTNTPTISGTAQNTSMVTVSASGTNGSTVGGGAPVVNGAWSYTFSQGLNPGTYFVQVDNAQSQSANVVEELAAATLTITGNNSTAPTATLTANGSINTTVSPGNLVTYAWSSTNAVSGAATVVVDSNDACGDVAGTQYPWLAGVISLGGTYTSSTTPCQAGHTYTITYTVTGQNGQTASANAAVHVSGGPIAQPCQVTNIYAQGVPGYVYDNLFMQVQGLSVPNGQSVAITGAGSYSYVTFTPVSTLGNITTLQASQTFNATAASYVMQRAGAIVPTSVNGSPVTCAPESSPSPTPTGSLAATNPTPIPYSIVAGGTGGVTVGSFTLQPSGENMNLQNIGLDLLAQSAWPGDLQGVSIWEGGTQVGAVNFGGSPSPNCPAAVVGIPGGGCYFATTTISSAATLAQNTQSNFVIKANLANVGAGQPAASGDDVIIGLADATAVGASSGSMYHSGPAPVSPQSGVRIFRSYPTVALVPIPSNGPLSDGATAMRFSVTASPNGPVGIEKLGFRLSETNAGIVGLTLRAFTDSGYSQPLVGSSNGVVATTPNFSGGSPVSIATLPQVVEIPAGQTVYFQLSLGLTAIGSNASISTTLLGDSSYSFGQSSISGNFIWSDNATTVSQLSNTDWTNGFGIPGLPMSGISQTITGSGSSSNNLSFSATPTSGAAPLSVTFNVASRNGIPSGVVIEDGDGTTANPAPVSCTNSIPASCNLAATHTYTQPGTYTAMLVTSPSCSVTSSNSSCGAEGFVYGTVTITVSGNNSTAPTATLTANGSTNITASVGTPISYTWSSTNGVSAQGTYTTDSPACGQSGTGPFPWGDGNTLAGTDPADSSITSCQAGHTYTLTYTVTGQNGQTAAANAVVHVSAASTANPTATFTANGSTNITVSPNTPISYQWSSTNGASASTQLTYTPAGGNTSAPTQWVDGNNNPIANTLSGNTSGTVPTSTAGGTFVITYTVTGSNGQTASASVTIHVASPQSLSATNPDLADLASALTAVLSILGKLK